MYVCMYVSMYISMYNVCRIYVFMYIHVRVMIVIPTYNLYIIVCMLHTCTCHMTISILIGFVTRSPNGLRL